MIGLPPDASVNGGLVDGALHLAHLLDAALIALFAGVLVVALIRFRSRNHPAVYQRGDSRREVAFTLGTVGLVFLGVDGSLWFRSQQAIDGTLFNLALPESNPQTVRVEVNAHQWAWDFRLPGPDGRFSTPDAPSDDDVVTWNDLHLPVGRPVMLALASTDVVHALYLPNFRLKAEVIPGTVRTVWFEAKQTGTYELGCSQFCGAHHDAMRATIVVESPEAFERWVAAKSEQARHGFDPSDVTARWGWTWERGR